MTLDTLSRKAGVTTVAAAPAEAARGEATAAPAAADLGEAPACAGALAPRALLALAVEAALGDGAAATALELVEGCAVAGADAPVGNAVGNAVVGADAGSAAPAAFGVCSAGASLLLAPPLPSNHDSPRQGCRAPY